MTHQQQTSQQVPYTHGTPLNRSLASVSSMVKNRRYAKLKSMKEERYFEEQDIMLRYPDLYYDYVGKYKKNTGVLLKPNDGTMGNFLSAQMLNSEYQRLLAASVPQTARQYSHCKEENNNREKGDKTCPESMQEMQKIEESPNYVNKCRSGIGSEMVDERDEYSDSCEEESNKMSSNQQNEEDHPFSIRQEFLQISPEDLCLQEQALLDHLELMFLDGLMPGIDYSHIDNNEQLDDIGVINRDLEEEYFQQISAEGDSDPQNNTGIQDF